MSNYNLNIDEDIYLNKTYIDTEPSLNTINTYNNKFIDFSMNIGRELVFY